MATKNKNACFSLFIHETVTAFVETLSQSAPCSVLCMSSLPTWGTFTLANLAGTGTVRLGSFVFTLAQFP